MPGGHGLLEGGATLLSSHAGPSPTGDERHSESQSGQPADSVKASQLAAGPTLSARPDATAASKQQARKRSPWPFDLTLVRIEAVAQTPGELAGSLLTVGSENGHLGRRALAIHRTVVAPSRSSAWFRKGRAAFPRRLYATAT